MTSKRRWQNRALSTHLCQCGCGQYTQIAVVTRTRDKVRAGEPLRYRTGHTSLHTTSRPTDRPCDPGTLDVCLACGQAVHLASQHDQRTCAAGHPSLMARGLCMGCYYKADRRGTLADYPRRLRSRDELLDEWEWLAVQGVGFREFPARVGVTFPAWERAFLRARVAGDPRAVRVDKGERVAA